MNETIDDIIMDFKKLISSEKNNDINNSIKIIFEKSDNSMMIFADKSRISQVIVNLLSNAVKFTPNGTIIISIDKKGKNNFKTISTSSDISSKAINNKIQLMSHNNGYNNDNDTYNNEITVKIKDTGSGLSQDIQSRLFEKFSSKSEKGIGLGLYISKKIIEAHNGSIQGENNHDCKGATFTFTLPINCS